MAELPKVASDSSVSFPSELGLCGMENSQIMDSPQGKVPENGFFVNRTERCDSFVLEMDELTLHVADNDFASSSRSTVHRTLSRKGSCQRGERKFPEKEPEAPSKGGGEKSVIVPVGTMGSDPTTTNVDSSIRYKRSMSMRRSPWLNPRRILMLFATVSSMGTIILIYFTLSIGKINGDAQQ